MLYDKLKEYSNEGVYPMHMPGHKRNGKFMPSDLPYDIDITEVYGFDDLHNANGILLESSKLAAELYGSFEAFMLVNGTTVGILAAIGAHTKSGDKILAVNNCHWSTPNAAKLFDLEIIYICADIDETSGVPCSISPSAIEESLKKDPNIKMVVITSPTYEGVVSDVAAIADEVHRAGALLLVDSAHGAHLGFAEFFPESAIKLGADIVVVSIHKTLPALTQCSLLHVCSERVDSAAIKEMLSILQTSSPSYVLMASIDYCLRLLKSDKDILFRDYILNLMRFNERLYDLRYLTVLCKGKDCSHPGFFECDFGKIVIMTKNTPLNSVNLADKLREEYLIEVERVFDDYVIALTSICDTQEGFIRLADALCEIDATLNV